MSLVPQEPDQNCSKRDIRSVFCSYTVSMRSSGLRIGVFRPGSFVLERAPWIRGLVFLAGVMSIPFAVGGSQNQVGNGLPYPSREQGLPPMNQTANPTADANRIMEDSMKLQDNRKLFDRMNLQRQKDMATYSAALIELAQQLKTDTDRGTPASLSTLEIQKAELIEKLAHSIQGKMRASVSVPH